MEKIKCDIHVNCLVFGKSLVRKEKRQKDGYDSHLSCMEIHFELGQAAGCLVTDTVKPDRSHPQEMQPCRPRGASAAAPSPSSFRSRVWCSTAGSQDRRQVLWRSLGLFRVLWCLLPQTGYVHPDEFFQSPEVMAGKAPDSGLR